MTPVPDILDAQTQAIRQAMEEFAAGLSRETVVRWNEPLARHTTLRIGGPADIYLEPASEEDLAGIIRFCARQEVRFFILGRGSNLLVRDGGFRGAAICLAQPAFGRVEVDGERLRCGAGAKLKSVAVEAKRSGLSGVEFLAGIPGSVGGALRMNAGAMGGATFDVAESVRLMDATGEIRECAARDLKVEYRACPLLKTHIALGAVFKCRTADRAEIEQRLKAFNEKRWESQPAAPSAGCLFKNPTGVPAGKLIDAAGLKGTHVGGAMVSMEHGNFIVNGGNATARDVLELIALLQERVKEARGVELHTEVEVVGED